MPLKQKEMEHARALQLSRHFDQAYTANQKLLAEDPENIQVLKALCELARDLKRNAEALQYASLILKHYPGDAETYLLIGSIFLLAGRYADGLAAVSKYIQFKPDHSAGFTMMGDLLYKLKEFRKSIKFYRQALHFSPQSGLILQKLAEVHFVLEQADEAEQYLDQLLHQEPGHPVALNLKGNLLMNKRSGNTARWYYERALANAPDYKDPATNLQILGFFEQQQNNPPEKPLFLGLPRGENFGWGICSRYLRQELAKRVTTCSVDYQDWNLHSNKSLPGPYFFALQDINLTTPYPARGTFNCGYTFFENELTHQSAENAGHYDLVLAGSSWCVDRLNEKDITHTDLLIQGIDPLLFYPVTERKSADTFVMFSGGKFELRKGQDLVLKAFQVLHKKYRDMHLVNIWYNFWPDSMETMKRSPHIRYEAKKAPWKERMEHVYMINGIDPARVTTYEVYDNKALRDLYQSTDLGIFPNRCEGGTNLVLMEYMACAKPVVASNATGHRDIVSSDNALLLNTNDDMEINDSEGNRIARWADPSLDELIAQIEFAYHNRDVIYEIGTQAGRDLKAFTWEDSAAQLLRALNV